LSCFAGRRFSHPVFRGLFEPRKAGFKPLSFGPRAGAAAQRPELSPAASDRGCLTPDGKVTVNSYNFGTVRFNLRDRTQTETLIRGKQHAIITELK
jgi:hypothetical protein